MKFKLKANEEFNMENIVKEVLEMKRENEDWDVDDCVNEVLQDYFMDMNFVVDMFKDIMENEDEIYNQISDAVWSYLRDEVTEAVEKSI